MNQQNGAATTGDVQQAASGCARSVCVRAAMDIGAANENIAFKTFGERKNSVVAAGTRHLNNTWPWNTI